MRKDDLAQVVFQAEELTAVQDHIEALENFVKQYAPNLNTEDRQNLGSINETNKLFVNKAKILMEQKPELVPSFMDTEEYNRDYIAREAIEKMLLRLNDITRKLEDTKILLDNDNYQDALTFYRSVRYLAMEHQQGAIPTYEEMKQYFPNRKNHKEE